MKKTILLTLMLLFSIHLSALAQTDQSSNFGIGIFGGYGFGQGSGHNQKQPAGNKSEGMWANPVYTAGIKFNYFFSENFSLNSGISYFHLIEKVKELDPANNTVSQTEFDMNYIKFPLSIRYGNFFYLGLGGYFAMQVGPTKKNQSGSTCDMSGNDIDRKDFGLSLETGFLIPFSSKVKTEIGLKIDWGFNKVVENNYQSLRNRTVYLTAGILLF